MLPTALGKPGTTNGPIPFYAQVKRVIIESNLLVGVKGPDLDFGTRYKVGWPKKQTILLPECCTITGNRFVRAQGGHSVTGMLEHSDSDPGVPRLSRAPSIFSGNILLGGTNGYEPSQSGFIEKPLPAGWSEEAELSKIKPLTSAEVGPLWMRGKGSP
ncbi:MAG: hypothetical protein WCO56_08310 [Verrucomicrobiota bacterium]